METNAVFSLFSRPLSTRAEENATLLLSWTKKGRMEYGVKPQLVRMHYDSTNDGIFASLPRIIERKNLGVMGEKICPTLQKGATIQRNCDVLLI